MFIILKGLLYIFLLINILFLFNIHSANGMVVFPEHEQVENITHFFNNDYFAYNEGITTPETQATCLNEIVTCVANSRIDNFLDLIKDRSKNVEQVINNRFDIIYYYSLEEKTTILKKITPLLCATVMENEYLIKLILQIPTINVNQQTKKSKNTPLLLAATRINTNLQIIDIFLRHPDTDYNIKNKWNINFLSYISKYKKTLF